MSENVDVGSSQARVGPPPPHPPIGEASRPGPTLLSWRDGADPNIVATSMRPILRTSMRFRLSSFAVPIHFGTVLNPEADAVRHETVSPFNNPMTASLLPDAAFPFVHDSMPRCAMPCIWVRREEVFEREGLPG